MPVLPALLAALRDGSVEVVDLTAPLESSTPLIKLPEPFGNTVPFALQEISRYDDRGPAWYWNNITTGEHTGTHFDAPVHWITGRDGEDVAQVPGRPADRARRGARLHRRGRRGPGLPARDRATSRSGSGEHGPLPEGGWLLYRTGWDARSHSPGARSSTRTRPARTRRASRSSAPAGWPRRPRSWASGWRPSAPTPGAAHSFDPPFPCHSFAARRRQVRPDPAAEPGPAARPPARW